MDASVLPSVYVKTLGIRNLHFEAVPTLQGARHPYGLQDTLPTLNLSHSQRLTAILLHRSKARYGWVANPFEFALLQIPRQGLSPC